MPKRVLVAEDAPVTRDTLAFLLTNRGYDVVESADGNDALAKARTLRPDAIVLDSDLPNQSAFDVFRALKKDPACSGIPILFLAAPAEAVDPKTRAVPDADVLVAKPFAAHDLIQRVTHVLDGATR